MTTPTMTRVVQDGCGDLYRLHPSLPRAQWRRRYADASSSSVSCSSCRRSIYVVALLRRTRSSSTSSMSVEQYTLKTFVNGRGAVHRRWTTSADLINHPDFWHGGHRTRSWFTSVRSSFSSHSGLLIALFYQHRFPLNSILRALILVPWLAPVLVSGAIWVRLLDQDYGVVNFFAPFVGLTSTARSPGLPIRTSR